jgi:hypothetical protein
MEFHPFCPMWDFFSPWQINGLRVMLQYSMGQKETFCLIYGAESQQLLARRKAA